MKSSAADIITITYLTEKNVSSTVCVELHKVSCCRNISVNFLVQVIKPVNKTSIWISPTQVICTTLIVKEKFLYLKKSCEKCYEKGDLVVWVKSTNSYNHASCLLLRSNLQKLNKNLLCPLFSWKSSVLISLVSVNLLFLSFNATLSQYCCLGLCQSQSVVFFFLLFFLLFQPL